MNPTTDSKAQVSLWRWAIHLGVMVLFILPNIILAGRVRHRPALTSTTTGLIIVCAWQVLAFAVISGLAWLASRASRDELLLRWRTDLWVLPLGVAYSVAIRTTTAIIIAMAFGLFVMLGVIDSDSLKQIINESRPAVEKLVDIHALETNLAYFWITITFGSFVVAGFCEELWRAFMLAGLRKLWPHFFGDTAGQIAAMAIIAVLFGAAHLEMGIIAMAAATLLGFQLGIIMVIHRSIWPAVLAHGLLDATSFAMLANVTR